MVTNEKYFDIQRKIVAHITGDSWQEAPHCTFTYDAEADGLLTELKKLNAARPKERKITVNTLVTKMIVEGIKESPELNSHITYSPKSVTGVIRQFDNIDISMPMILPDGRMMTITMVDFDKKNIDEMLDYIDDVRRRMMKTNLAHTMYEVSLEETLGLVKQGKLLNIAQRLKGAFIGKGRIHILHGSERRQYESIPRSERLTKDDIRQGTVTITNIGSLYRTGKVTSHIINLVKPQVCAFCINAVKTVPTPVKKADGSVDIENKRILPVTLAIDHRAIDFGMCVPMLEKFDEICANPSVIYDWVDKEYTAAAAE